MALCPKHLHIQVATCSTCNVPDDSGPKDWDSFFNENVHEPDGGPVAAIRARITRQEREQHRYDSADVLHADRRELLKYHDTEREMHYAWRKRAEEAEAQRNDLLAVLKDMTEDLEARWDMRDRSTNPGIVVNVERANAAIAKAEGK
jgi:hypothetical protein